MNSGYSQIELDSTGSINQTSHLITLSKAKMILDEFYSKITNIINNSIEMVREEKSQLIYHSPFNELSNDQQANMRRVVQTRVIEYSSTK